MSSSSQAVPEWAYPLTRQQYGRFLATVAEELDYLQLDGDRTPDAEGTLILQVRGSEVSLQVSLHNLAQSAALRPETEWGSLLREIYANAHRIQQLNEQKPTPDQLRVRLYPKSYLDVIPKSKTSRQLHRPVAGDIIEMIVVDYPTMIAALLSSQLKELGLSEDQAWEVAKVNARRNQVYRQALDIGAPVLRLTSAQNEYTNAAVLWLEEALARPLPHGALVSVPARELTIVHPIDDENCRAALLNLALRAPGGEARGPYGLSSKIYWYHDHQLELIPIDIDVETKTIKVFLPSELERAMEQLSQPDRNS